MNVAQGTKKSPRKFPFEVNRLNQQFGIQLRPQAKLSLAPFHRDGEVENTEDQVSSSSSSPIFENGRAAEPLFVSSNDRLRSGQSHPSRLLL